MEQAEKQTMQVEALNEATEVRNPTIWDLLLSKYLSVWYWSILFAGTTGLTFTSLGYRDYGRWGNITPILIIMTALGLLLLYLAWRRLYLYFYRYLLPQIFDIGKVVDQRASQEEAAEHLGVALRRLVEAIGVALVNALIRAAFATL